MAGKLRDFFNNFITSGKQIDASDESQTDTYLRYMVLNILALVLALTLTLIGILEIRAGETALGVLNLLMLIPTMAGALMLRSNIHFNVSALFLVLAPIIFTLFLVIQGDNDGSDIMWVFIFPLVSILILELYMGIALSITHLVIVAAVLFVPGISNHVFSPNIGIRVLAAYIFIFAAAIIYEKTRLVKDKMTTRFIRSIQAERDGITANLKAGVFVMNREFKIQPLYSKALEDIFSEKDLTGENFADLLVLSLNSKEQETLKDYLSMIFEHTYDQQMLDDMNPLQEFTYFSVTTREEKLLTCGFTLIERDEGEYMILGSIHDITVERNLQKKLAKEENLRQEEMRSLFEIFQIEPRVLNDFIEDMEYEFEQINQNLQKQALSSTIIMVEVYQSIHAIKANALILGLEKFATKLHDMESKIKPLQDKRGISFDDVLDVTVDLEMLMREKDKLNALVERLQSFRLGGSGKRQEEYVLVKTLSRACEKTSEDLGKKVHLEIKGIDKRALEFGPRRVIREVLTQLVKNAIVHGIESQEERISGGKPEMGKISISIRIKEDQITIRCQDDGKGLDFAGIQQKARNQRLFSNQEDLEDKRHLLQVIFSPGFSTAGEINLHAGRGIGLSMVRQRIQEVKGAIKLQTEPDKGTVFTITIPLKQDKEQNIVPFVDRRRDSSGVKQA